MIALYIVKAEWWLSEQVLIHILQYILLVGIDTGTNKTYQYIAQPYSYLQVYGIIRNFKQE